MEIENLHRLVGLLQKFRKDGMLDNAAVEAVLKPVASMNEKLQEEYAVEMLSVLKTSGDKEEILSRQGMVLQMLYADRLYMDFGENPVQEDEQESDPRPGAKQGARQNSESEGCSVGLNPGYRAGGGYFTGAGNGKRWTVCLCGQSLPLRYISSEKADTD